MAKSSTELRDKYEAAGDGVAGGYDRKKHPRKWKWKVTSLWLKMERLVGNLKHKMEQRLHLYDHSPYPPPPPQQPLHQSHSDQPPYPSQQPQKIGRKQLRAWELFGEVRNSAAPAPTQLWSPELKRSPLPTNSFWLNYVLNSGSQPEYIHPYLVQSLPGSISVCYPSRSVTPGFILQPFVPDITINHGRGSVPHSVTRFDDLSVTLEVPGKGVKVPLVRGSPYVTMVLKNGPAAPIVVSTIHAVLDCQQCLEGMKHRITMNNGQTWILYSTSPVQFVKEGTSTLRSVDPVRTSVIRVALLPPGDDRGTAERVLDEFSGRYPVGGHTTFDRPFHMSFNWKSRGNDDCGLLMLTLPMHRDLMVDVHSSATTVSRILRYASIDGMLAGHLGVTWTLRVTPLPATFYTFPGGGICDDASRDAVCAAVETDVTALAAITTTSSYFYGKAAARAARLALIAEEVGYYSVLPRLAAFLRESLTPWLDGSFGGNGIGYDGTWGGLISKAGSQDAGADFGIGNYNDHHYHWGYFVYAAAVLAKLDADWGTTWRRHVEALVADYMSFGDDSSFPRLRNFDTWLLHSWAGGVVEFADGRNQESTSEAANAYYAAAMLGLAYGDVTMVNHGLTLAAFEAYAARSLWHIPSSPECSIYEQEFTRDNRFVGVLWANKRDTGLWFAAAEARECRLGIQVLPITPLTQALFPDPAFARQAAEWTKARVELPSVSDGWKGFVYALLAAGGDARSALEKTMALKEHDDGNSLSNMLWWILSRPPPRAQI